MVDLITRLPNELLREICLFASIYDRSCPLRNLALVNKQIRQVAFPLLVRHWERDSSFHQPHLGQLALHLLRYPKHRTQVKSLNFMFPSKRKTDSRGRISYDQAPVSLRPQSLTELARAAEGAIPHLAQSSKWVRIIRKVCFHAVAALVLAWTTRVTDVAMELPRPYVRRRMSDSYDMMMRFFHGAAQKVCARGQNEHCGMPLAEVQRLQIETWERKSRHNEVMEFPLSVFQLPRLNKLHIKHLELRESQEVPIPRGCSTIEELFLGRSKVKGASLGKILAACPKLRVLHHAWFGLILEFPDKRMIRDALINEAGSLEELFDTGTVIHQNFKSLYLLRKFILDVEDLYKVVEDPREVMPNYSNAQLPASLEELTFIWGNPSMLCLEEVVTFMGDHDIWLRIVVAIKTLLEEAGPGCKFNKLRFLDVRQILAGSEEQVKIMELGKSKGIKVLEYNLRSWPMIYNNENSELPDYFPKFA